MGRKGRGGNEFTFDTDRILVNSKLTLRQNNSEDIIGKVQRLGSSDERCVFVAACELRMCADSMFVSEER